MSSPAGEASFIARFSKSVGQAMQIATGVGAVSYAFGWLLTARFYGALGVDPEEAGVTFSWLATRAFLVGLLSLVVVLGVHGLLQLAMRKDSISWRIQSQIAIAISVQLTCIGIAGIVAIVYVWLTPDGADPTSAVVAILVCGVLVGLAMLSLRPSCLNIRLNLRYYLRALAGVLLGLLIVCLVLLPFRLGDWLADEVRAGHPVTIDMPPGLPLIKVGDVWLTPADPSKPIPVSGCALRLGGNAGTTVYMVNGRVLRMSDQNVAVLSPC